MHSSKDVYPAIILSTFQCTVFKNGHTHNSNLVVFTAKMSSCVCVCVCVCVCACVRACMRACVRVTILRDRDLLFIDLQETQKQMQLWA